MAKSTVAAELVLRLFNASTTTHLYHLQTTSFSQHMALDTFYKTIIDLGDDFAETYQGNYGLLTDYPDEYPCVLPEKGTPALEMLSDLRDWVEENRDEIGTPTDTHLQNIIDEIVQLIDSTRYKLRFLK